MSADWLERRKQIGPALAALAWGTFPAFLVYLLVLQSPVVSRVRLALTIPFVLLFAFAMLRTFPRLRSLGWQRVLALVLSSGVLALFAREAFLFHPERAYLFFGQHTLTITVSATAPVELRGMQTSLGDVSYSIFQDVSGWDTQGNRLVSASAPSALTWRGWTGDHARVQMWGPAGTQVMVSWDGQPDSVSLAGGDVQEIPHTFSMPLVGSLALIIVLWGAISYGIALPLGLLSASARETSALGRWIRLALWVCSGALLMGLILRIYLPIHPHFVFPDRDSGVFLYAGQHILKGEIPYRDVWDHKGPLMLYLNALGLLFSHGSAWGVWGLELAWILLTLLTLFLLLRRVVGDVPAVAGSLVFLVGLGQALAGGNFSEEYGLLFQALALTAFWRFLRSERTGWLAGAGAAVGLSFLLRPNQIGLGVGLGLYFIARVWTTRFSRPSLHQSLTLLAGFLAPILLTLLYFAVQGALADLFDAVILFNFAYVGHGQFDPLRGFYLGLFSFPSLGFWLVAGGAALAMLLLSECKSTPQSAFWGVVGGSFLAELVLSGLSGAAFKHYSLPWLPFAAAFSALFGDVLYRAVTHPLQARERVVRSALALVFSSWLAFYGLQVWSGLSQVYSPVDWSAPPVWDTPQHPSREIARYLQPDSTLLMWGGEAAINYTLGVGAPSRFVYQYPLAMPEYATPDMVTAFTAEVEKSLPVIVDASMGNPRIVPLDPARREAAMSTPEGRARFAQLQPFFDFFDSHYRRTAELSYKGWTVYLPIR